MSQNSISHCDDFWVYHCVKCKREVDWHEWEKLRFKILSNQVRPATTEEAEATPLWICHLHNVLPHLHDVNPRLVYRWTQAFCAGGGPSPRSSHASAVVGDTLVVMGGQSQAEVFSDCHILCLVTLTWRQVYPPPLSCITCQVETISYQIELQYLSNLEACSTKCVSQAAEKCGFGILFPFLLS